MGLWWLCALSVDDSRGNEHMYDLTKILFSNQTFATRVFGGSPASRCREVVIGVLEFFEETNIFPIGEKIGKEVSKKLNHLGATKQLISLDREYIKEFLKKNI